MIQSEILKRKPKLPKFLNQIRLFDLIFNKTAQAVLPYIYLPFEIYEKLCSNEININYYALYLHEKKHLERQKNVGLITWLIKYTISTDFRFEEEMLAEYDYMRCLKNAGHCYPLEYRSKIFSGWTYLRPKRFNEVKKRLSAMWESI